MKKKKNKAGGAGPKAPKAATDLATKQPASRAEKRVERRQRRAAKLEKRRRDKQAITGEMWAEPAPAHLVTNDPKPPPGFKFVLIGDPTLTNACKELSRARDAMIFIVSGFREENSKVSEHMFRIGYHFRESIVDDASEILGETAVSNRRYDPNEIEPIPESQEEINKQADSVIRDLFPRIPHTDRQMVLDHAFKKGALFHGEPTVGLQPTIPLSRRVQLAVLAHIRHTHTRYDKLLRETSWMNARKVVEPICLDVLVKWRGDEETGRDQMEEIIREVVIITDSEESDESSDEDDSSDEEGEVTSVSSASISQPGSRNQHRPAQSQNEGFGLQGTAASTSIRFSDNATVPKDKKAQRGFKRYQAAWNDALTRRHDNPRIPEAAHGGTSVAGVPSGLLRSRVVSPYNNASQYTSQAIINPTLSNAISKTRYYDDSQSTTRQDPYHSQQRPAPTNFYHDEVMVRPVPERQTSYQFAPHQEPSVYTTRDKGLPLVVRGSPTGHNLQDMLVPSIETASSDAVNDPSRLERHLDVYDGPRESYPRRGAQSVASATPHQAIVINDDSPQMKRRRVVYEDDHGHFRPLPPRDANIYSTAARADSHMLPVQRDVLARHERPSQSGQGLFRDRQPPLAGRIPIYDATPDSSHFPSAPDRYRRSEGGYVPIQRYDSPIQRHVESPQPFFEETSESPYTRRPISGDVRVIQNDRAYQAQPFENAGESSYIRRPVSGDTRIFENGRANQAQPEIGSRTRSERDGYQAFLDNFSQSRLDPPLPRARDVFAAPSSHENSTTQVNAVPRYEDRLASFTTLQPEEARSPARYVERPMRVLEERRPIFYSNRQFVPDFERNIVDRPAPIREYTRLSPEGDSPTYVRTVRRPVIVLE